MKVLDGYKVYVQVKDIVALQRLGFTMPIDTYAVISSIQSETHLKQNDFIAFSEASTIAFFKGINFVLDLGFYYYKSFNEVAHEIKKVERKIAFLEEMINKLEDEDRLRCDDELEMEKHKLEQLIQLASIKNQHLALSLPISISDVKMPKIK